MEKQCITSITTLPEKVKINTTRKNVNRRFDLSESNNRIKDNTDNADQNGEKDAAKVQIYSSIFGTYISYIADIMKTV